MSDKPAPAALECQSDIDKDLVRSYYGDIEAFYRVRAALAATPAVGGEAIAWRWRHVNSPSKDWNYQHQPIGNHNEYLEVEPLYAAPPASPLRPTDNSGDK